MYPLGDCYEVVNVVACRQLYGKRGVTNFGRFSQGVIGSFGRMNLGALPKRSQGWELVYFICIIYLLIGFLCFVLLQ